MTFNAKHDTGGSSQLLYVRPGEPIPMQLYTLVASEGIAPVVVSFGGGNAGLTQAQKDGMPAYFATALYLFNGTGVSGGSGHFNEERELTSFEITQVPALLAMLYKCVAIGSTPLTTLPRLGHKHGNMLIDAYGGELDTRAHGNLVVSLHPSERGLGWNGDLVSVRIPFLLSLLEMCYNVSGFIYNGGDVTAEEIFHFLEMTVEGGRLFVAQNSGREADKFARGWLSGNMEWTNAKGAPLADELIAKRESILKDAVRDLVFIVPADDADATHKVLVEQGVVPAE